MELSSLSYIFLITKRIGLNYIQMKFYNMEEIQCHYIYILDCVNLQKDIDKKIHIDKNLTIDCVASK